jgi:hypothetical protein
VQHQYQLFYSTISSNPTAPKKTPPAASKHGDPGATIAYIGHSQLPGPGATGASKRPPDPGKVVTSMWSLDPGGVGISKMSPDLGAVGTSKWPPDPGADGTNEFVSRPK